MVNPTRITVAFDNPTAVSLEKISTDDQLKTHGILGLSSLAIVFVSFFSTIYLARKLDNKNY